MSDFKAKMYQIQFRLGLCPRPCWGSLERSPGPLAGLRGPTSKGRGRGRERRAEGRGQEGEGRWEGRGQEGEGETRGGDETPPLHASPNPYFWIRPWDRQKSWFWANIWLHCVLWTVPATSAMHLAATDHGEFITLVAGKRLSLLMAGNNDEVYDK